MMSFVEVDRARLEQLFAAHAPAVRAYGRVVIA